MLRYTTWKLYLSNNNFSVRIRQDKALRWSQICPYIDIFEKLSKGSIVILCILGTWVYGFSLQLTRLSFFFNSFTIAVKILLSFMFELKQMEAIDSDEFKGNSFFFCLSAREQCRHQLNLNGIIVCCYLSRLLKIFFISFGSYYFNWKGYTISKKTREMFLIEFTDWQWEAENTSKNSFSVPPYPSPV